MRWAANDKRGGESHRPQALEIRLRDEGVHLVRVPEEARQSGHALGDALRINTALTSLDLSFNSIGPSGGAAIADSLCLNGTLKTLDLQ